MRFRPVKVVMKCDIPLHFLVLRYEMSVNTKRLTEFQRSIWLIVNHLDCIMLFK
jgi:hypothetical protein